MPGGVVEQADTVVGQHVVQGQHDLLTIPAFEHDGGRRILRTHRFQDLAQSNALILAQAVAQIQAGVVHLELPLIGVVGISVAQRAAHLNDGLGHDLNLHHVAHPGFAIARAGDAVTRFLPAAGVGQDQALVGLHLVHGNKEVIAVGGFDQHRRGVGPGLGAGDDLPQGHAGVSADQSRQVSLLDGDSLHAVRQYIVVRGVYLSADAHGWRPLQSDVQICAHAHRQNNGHTQKGEIDPAAHRLHEPVLDRSGAAQRGQQRLAKQPSQEHAGGKGHAPHQEQRAHGQRIGGHGGEELEDEHVGCGCQAPGQTVSHRHCPRSPGPLKGQHH